MKWLVMECFFFKFALGMYFLLPLARATSISLVLIGSARGWMINSFILSCAHQVQPYEKKDYLYSEAMLEAAQIKHTCCKIILRRNSVQFEWTVPRFCNGSAFLVRCRQCIHESRFRRLVPLTTSLHTLCDSIHQLAECPNICHFYHSNDAR